MFVCGKLICHTVWGVRDERFLNSKNNNKNIIVIFWSKCEKFLASSCIRFQKNIYSSEIEHLISTCILNIFFVCCELWFHTKHQMRGQSKVFWKQKLSVHKPDRLSCIYCFDDRSFFDFTWGELYVKFWVWLAFYSLLLLILPLLTRKHSRVMSCECHLAHRCEDARVTSRNAWDFHSLLASRGYLTRKQYRTCIL